MSTENEGQNFSALHVVSATPHSLGGNTVPQDKTEHPPGYGHDVSRGRQA